MEQVSNFFLALLIVVNSVNIDTTEVNGIYKRPITSIYKNGKIVEVNDVQLISFTLKKENDSDWTLSYPYHNKTVDVTFKKNTVELENYYSYKHIEKYDWVNLNNFKFENKDNVFPKENDTIPILGILKSPEHNSIIFKSTNKEENNEFEELLINYN